MASLINPRRRFGSERGAEMVEFALIAPLLLLIIGGIADFGFLFQSFEVTTNAAREGARVAILPGYDADADDDGQPDAVVARVNQYLQTSNLLGAHTTNVATETIDLGGAAVDVVRVTVTYTQPMWIIGPIVGMMNGSFVSDLTYRTAAVMRTEMQAGAGAP
jgi:Flp pilus assembly protein TadG